MIDNVIYKVLWVDDQISKDENGNYTIYAQGYISKAEDYNIELVGFDNWEEGEAELRKNFDDYSAIILDAFCKISKNDSEQEEFITSILPSLNILFGEKRKLLPWYILSAGTMANFESTIKSARYQHAKHEEEWGEMLYLKRDEDDDNENVHNLFKNIINVAQNMSMNVVLYRHKDSFNYMGKDKLLSSNARKLMLHMLSHIYFPENNTNFVFEGNPLRKVMEFVFRAAYSKGLLPKECFERGDQINLLEANRYMSGLNTKHSHLRYGNPGNKEEGRGGDSIFPEYMGNFTRAIIEFGSIDSHTNEAYPYTIDDKDLSLTENEKELYFSFVLQLCHVIKYFGKFVENHPNVDSNKSMIKVLSRYDPAVFEGYEGNIEQDKNNNFFCGECLLSYMAAQNSLGKRVRLHNVRNNDNPKTKFLYTFVAKFELI